MVGLFTFEGEGVPLASPSLQWLCELFSWGIVLKCSITVVSQYEGSLWRPSHHCGFVNRVC